MKEASHKYHTSCHCLKNISFLLHSFCVPALQVCGCMCICVCHVSILQYVYIYHFEVLCIHFVGLVKCGVLTLVVRYRAIEIAAIIIIIIAYRVFLSSYFYV